ncbi:hypothetical protein GCM10010121_000650 [Streptomyces brasiliensis]|uniref:Uncharacterized protein n=1 Tax=Streptomyces brasiliensis TaxID=1954 RepID=A0A917NFX0_9ACTN|nr:hypothetical protein GCM10010121_000650 [Streptomyces brasiliensis]
MTGAAALGSRVRSRSRFSPGTSSTIARSAGRFPGDTTRMHVTYYNVNKPHGELSVFEQFTLHRKRSDGRR